MRLSLPRVQHARHDETGFAMVFFTLTVVVLMVFVALTVDLGAGFNERREDVSAADGAVLAAMQDTTDAARVATAVDYANSTLGESLTTADFNTCTTDPSALTVRATGSNCISFSSDRRTMRVRLPTRFLSHFGKAAGLPEVPHDAAATARIVTAGFGGVLPFAIGANSASHVCLKTGPTAGPPCDGPDAGNFGTLNFRFFGSSLLNTSPSCTLGDPGHNRLKNNMSAGVDHDLSTYGPDSNDAPWFTTVVDDHSVCPNHTQLPNATNTDTGNTPNFLGSGIFYAPHGTYSDGGPGRLQRRILDWWGASRRTTISGRNVDDTALWEFIPPEDGTQGPSIVGTNVPNSCQRNQFIDNGLIDGSGQGILTNTPPAVQLYLLPRPVPERLRLLMERCFDHYRGLTWAPASDPPVGCSGVCTAPVFGRNSRTEPGLDLLDMQLTPRFGYVPQLWPGDNPNGNSTVRFDRFRALFMHRLCIGNNDNNCVKYEPGLNQSVGGQVAIANYLTAFVFEANMLPNGLAADGAPFKLNVNRRIALIR